MRLVVTEDLDGVRLDRAAAELTTREKLPISRARLKRAIEEGAVRVNGRRSSKGTSVAKADVITIEEEKVPAPDAPAVPSPDAPLEVVFEGEGVLVVDKPAGVPSAPLRFGETGTLANAVVGRYPELAGVGYSPREPGLLHRLDTDTSGLLVVARSQIAFTALKAALQAGRVEKQYLLVCTGADLPDSGQIEIPLASHPKDQRRVLACIHPRDVMRYDPRAASTSYRVLKRGGPWALVEARVARALRHQIRAHFAAIGHALAGDALYGGPEVPGLGRHALHASRVAFPGDRTARVAAFDVKSSLPPELQGLVV